MSENIIKTEKGYNLYCRYWNEDSKYAREDIKALLFIVHGYCEHCLFYNELAETLKEQGLYVFSHDHVGHGQSEGTRAHVGDFMEYVQDVFYHIELVKKKFPQKPVFLLGHSMIAAGKIAARFRPQMIVAKIDPLKVSRDAVFVKRYKEDPLVWHEGVKCGWGVAMLHALSQITSSFQDMTLPFIVLHGSEDTICELEGSQLLYDKAASKDKQIKIFDGAFHQIHNDTPDVKKETNKTISQWIADRL
ncbi:monoglyceride lipase-like isoform X2 [Dreissena polymorpha]|uniref:monoglyceride lipase-like isoform X2 n=1 Tax=Dreissena polymorpha TaxID=45954 RepID=UPI0022643438|nr:monoglyceride lipase-like isoform X2 [Dreissena polymorpha]